MKLETWNTRQGMWEAPQRADPLFPKSAAGSPRGSASHIGRFESSPDSFRGASHATQAKLGTNAFRSTALLLILVVLVTGCASAPKFTPEQLAAIERRLDEMNPPAELRPLYRLQIMEGERNHVLNGMKLAGVAIRHGYYDDAKRVLDECILRIGAITAGDRQAAAGRSTFKEEAVKPFKGEPYERAMVYAYRGLLYYRDGVYDNARACFRSALLEDAYAEGQEYKADYAGLEYLSARCSQKLRTGDAEDALKRARESVRGHASLPSFDPDNNLLLFVGLGTGPMKVGAGRHGEKLTFYERPQPEKQVRVFVDGQLQGVVSEIDNLVFQATTRGGRKMDHILAGKAVFKDTTATIGEVGLLTGAGLAIAGAGSKHHSDELLIAGAAAAAVGAIAAIFSSQAQPQSDTRYWDNLPEGIHLYSTTLAPGTHRLHFEFLDAKGVKVSGLDREVDVTIPEDGKEQVVIIHSR